MRGCMGLTCYGSKRILINLSDAKKYNVIATLVHELVHVRCQRLRHGKEFKNLERIAIEKVWNINQ